MSEISKQRLIDGDKLQSWLEKSEEFHKFNADTNSFLGRYNSAEYGYSMVGFINRLNAALQSGIMDARFDQGEATRLREALRDAADTIDYLMRDYPNELWGKKETEDWESIGKVTINAIHEALFTHTDGGPCCDLNQLTTFIPGITEER